jgi:excisionase family DNA binding protein
MMIEKQIQEKLLSLQEVMQWLQVSDSTLRRWVNSNKIEACKLVGQWRFEESEVKRFIAARKRVRDRQVPRIKRPYTRSKTA